MSTLRRTPFKPKTPAQRQARQWSADRLPSARAAVVVPFVDAAIVAVPKGVRAKPGKGAPTVEEQRWIRAMQDFGCFACWCDGVSRVPGEYHHLVEAGRRLGHAYGYLLCSPGHHQPLTGSGKISIHPGRRPEFIRRYGTEREILARLQAMLGFKSFKQERLE